MAALTHAQIRRRKVLLPPADRLVDYLEDFAALYKLRIAYGQVRILEFNSNLIRFNSI